MVRDISSAVQAEKDKRANIPTELYQVFLPDQTLYFVVWPNSLDYYDELGGTQTYQPAAITRNPIKRNKSMEIDRFDIQIDNVGRDWSAYAANYNLAGTKVNIWKVFLEREGVGSWDTWDNAFTLSSNWTSYTSEVWEDVAQSTDYYDYNIKGDFDDHVNMFTGYIHNPKISEQSISVTLKSSLNKLDVRMPGRKFGSKCSWTFGSPECGVNPPTETGSIQDLDSSHITVTLESLADTNWKHGTFETGNETRVITDFDVASNTLTLEFGLPADVEVGDSYEVTAGCSKVKSDGTAGCDFWNNKQYFGGFPALPEIRNIRQ